MNTEGNPKIAEAGKPTQFGVGIDPVKASKLSQPWSIRKSLRYLLGQSQRANANILEHLPPEPTYAQMIAANTINKALKGDMRAVEFCTENNEGKLAQPNLNADMARLQEMSDEELNAELERLQKIIAAE